MAQKLTDVEYHQRLTEQLTKRGLWGRDIVLNPEDRYRFCKAIFNGWCVNQGAFQGVWGPRAPTGGSVVLFKDRGNRDAGRVILLAVEKMPPLWVGILSDSSRLTVEKKFRLLPTEPKAKKVPKEPPKNRFDRDFDL